MSIVEKKVKVSAPVDAAFSALEELIADLLEGKASAELQADALGVFALFGQVKDIKPDWDEDAEAVERTIALGGEHFARRIIGILKSKAAVAPGK